MTIPPHTAAQLLKTSALLATVVAVAAVGAWRYRVLPPPLRYLAWLAWFELPLEVWGSVLGFFRQNNLFIMPFYTVGELALLTLVYCQAVPVARFRRAAPWLVGAFAAYTLVDSLTVPDLTWFRPGQQVAQSLLILGMVFLYFRQLLHDLRVPRLTREPMFWVSVGLALYFVGYLHIALFSNYMLQHYSHQFNVRVWDIHTVLTLLLHSCYCVALLLASQPHHLEQQQFAPI